MRIPFGTQSYQHRSLPLSAQRMVNCYLETAPPAAKTLAAVVQSYGIKEWATAGTGLLRGGVVVNDVPYVVSGTKLYRINAAGTATELGDIPGSGHCHMMGDGHNVVVVTGGLGYVWNGTSVAQITDADFPGAAWVQYLDGYAVIAEPDSGRVYIAGPLTPLAWDALDFATAESSPDDVLAGIVDHGELFLFGRDSTEGWYNSGDTDFPLTRIASARIEKGIGAPLSAAKHDNTVFFVAHDWMVMRMDGYTPIRISTHAIEQALEAAADKNFRGFTWTEAGHAFYAITSTSGTWVFDISTNLWHERKSDGYAFWRPAFILRAYGKWIVGDSVTNKIGELDPNTFAEWGSVLRSSATSPPISEDNRWLFHHRLELVFEQGVGLATGQGSNPLVMIRFSDDGGRTWSNEKHRSLGAIGEYKKRTCVNRCGRARDRVYEFAVSDPVRRTLILATAEIEQGGY